ncbi:MAG: hypothetical protein JWL90_947 [Chthoniobacteraceae bacterium]|nr:hypothetical protein [Chthoniobacteraceae bacterium]
MTSLSSLVSEEEMHMDDNTSAVAPKLHCYSLTIFTQKWREVRDFYVEILNARVTSEREDRYSEMDLGGLPLTIRNAEHGELVTYLHLYVSAKNCETVLKTLRSRGIIVTTVGPYTNFRDPEGRVIKLSEQKMVIV